MVALIGEGNNKPSKIKYSVSNINDLVKISDELEKPIFYEQKRNLKDVLSYYVLHDNIMCLYEIRDNKESTEKRDNTKEITIA